MCVCACVHVCVCVCACVRVRVCDPQQQRLTPGMAQSLVSFLRMATNSRTGLPSAMILLPLASLFHLETIGSTAWLGPHLPSNPRPIIPVRPTGFL